MQGSINEYQAEGRFFDFYPERTATKGFLVS
jgi:hypothetical protein